MDTTRTEELLTQLGAADPAAAPDLADALTATLAEALDDSGPDDPDVGEASDERGAP
ncbi:MAG: hypothetical protein HKN80_03935 [Acidimicrobiia bacterium]|nr:hypothetical protein [Acidimicrobiia bacterium]